MFHEICVFSGQSGDTIFFVILIKHPSYKWTRRHFDAENAYVGQKCHLAKNVTWSKKCHLIKSVKRPKRIITSPEKSHSAKKRQWVTIFCQVPRFQGLKRTGLSCEVTRFHYFFDKLIIDSYLITLLAMVWERPNLQRRLRCSRWNACSRCLRDKNGHGKL